MMAILMWFVQHVNLGAGQWFRSEITHQLPLGKIDPQVIFVASLARIFH